MTPLDVGIYAIVALIVLIYIGLPIGIGMLAVSFAGVTLIRNDTVATRMIGAVANDSLQLCRCSC
jgi:C4-dicarboxylate transporter DctM subunit